MNRKAIFTDLAPAQVCHASGENKIEGEGWVWFGDDDVFGDNAYSVIWQNKYLLSDYHEKNKTYNKSIIRNDSKLVGFNVEASFKGQNALTFMKKMGYEFKPVQADIFEENFDKIPLPKGETKIIIQINEKYFYKKNNSYESGKIILDNSLMTDVRIKSFAKIARYKLFYSDDIIGKYFSKAMNIIYPKTKPAIYDNWNNYKEHYKSLDELMLDFIKEFGVE